MRRHGLWRLDAIVSEQTAGSAVRGVVEDQAIDECVGQDRRECADGTLDRVDRALAQELVRDPAADDGLRDLLELERAERGQHMVAPGGPCAPPASGRSTQPRSSPQTPLVATGRPTPRPARSDGRVRSYGRWRSRVKRKYAAQHILRSRLES